MLWTGLWGLPVGAALGFVQLRLLEKYLKAVRLLWLAPVKFMLSLGVMAVVAACNYWALIFVAVGYLIMQAVMWLRYMKHDKGDG